MVRRGIVWFGEVRCGKAGVVRCGRLRRVRLRYGVAGEVRFGTAWLGEVWQGVVWFFI
jgi:hypothetical protein